jgi:hypothetical protein
MGTLPIYRLNKDDPALDDVHDLARKSLGLEDYSLHQAGSRRLVRSITKRVDIDIDRGAVWAADHAELWRPERTPQLPNAQKAREIVEGLIKRDQLIPQVGHDRFVIEPLGVAGSRVATLDKKSGQRRNRQLDQRVSYGARMVVSDPETGSTLHAPVIGGGGKFAVTLGSEGKVIGYNRSWLPIDTTERHATYIPRKEADARFRQLTSHLNVKHFDADLAYTQVQLSMDQRYLCPVWAYRASAQVKAHEFPLRIISLPATEFGPEVRPIEPHPKRSKREIPWGLHRMARKRGLAAVNPYEAGTSWIGQVGGLSGSPKNAQGFVDGLREAGWTINFNWGDCNAWESDWHENDDVWVDAADFVFYTGHAGVDGWMLVEPGTCNGDWLTPPEVGGAPETPGDIWGQQDLEWIIIAACGPLEDDIISSPGGGNVLERWDGAFDGLHILMGYGAVTFDNEEEGKRVIQYAREGQRLIDAWFRTGQEIQPATNGWPAPYGPTIYVGAMWASKSGQPSPADDHLWGYGSVATDPTSPDSFTCMWIPC